MPHSHLHGHHILAWHRHFSMKWWALASFMGLRKYNLQLILSHTIGLSTEVIK
jgi:hypothetical protein